MTLFDTLDILEWTTEHFGSLHTNRRCTRRDVMQAVKLGYAESVGLAQPCDGDGFVIEGRAEREGFTLTDAGRVALAEFRRDLDLLHGARLLPGSEGA